jgi:flavin reductase (DIM6/NTAB) family NADH-FMN oxidoreductase RutF
MAWSCGEAGAPILKDSLCVFECERFAVYDGATTTSSSDA